VIRRSLSVLAVAALVGAAAPAGAASPSVVELCTSDPLGGTGAAAQLARLMSTARFESRGPPCDAPSGRRYLVTFVARESAVFLRLVDSAGMRLERRVPWLTGVERPLARLELEGRLVEFSLLLESLLAEARNPLPAFEPTPPVEAVVEPRPAPKSIGRKTDGARRSVSRPATKAAARRAAGSGVEEAAGARTRAAVPGGASGVPGTSGPGPSPATEGESVPADASGSAPSEGAGEGDGPASGIGAGEGADESGPASSGGAADGDLPAPESDPGESDPGPAPAEGARDGAGAGSEIGAAGDASFDEHAEGSFWSGWRLQASGVGGLRWREPGLSSPEAGLRVAFGPYWIRGAVEGEAEWDLGAPIRISAMSASAGAEVPLFGKGAWGAVGLAGVGVDRLELRRADFEGARSWRIHDVGPLAGFLLGWESGPVASSLLVEAQWSPTARRIWLPEGTSGRLGPWSVRAGVTLGWKR